jgi:nucleotide-binding universal stress UspA family protein
MKTILVINESSSAAHPAVLLAISIAQQTGAHLLLANIRPVSKKLPVNPHALVPMNTPDAFVPEPMDSLLEELDMINHHDNPFKPDIQVLPAATYAEADIVALINKHHVWMVISNVQDYAAKGKLNLQTILNKIQCPLMLVPENFDQKSFDRIVYTADLRYCRIEVLRYLMALAKPYQASLLIAHLSASGLPHLDDNYAEMIFKESIYPLLSYPQLNYQNIRERDMNKAVDVLVNGMDTDLLVLENHRFHFEEILGMSIPDRLPSHLVLPILIFPY